MCERAPFALDVVVVEVFGFPLFSITFVRGTGSFVDALLFVEVYSILVLVRSGVRRSIHPSQTRMT